MLVIKALEESSHVCVMLTGDAPLTALSVAQEVGIAQHAPEKALILNVTESGGLEWCPAVTSSGSTSPGKVFEPLELEELSKAHDLIFTGKSLEEALRSSDSVCQHLHAARIFARLSPSQKELIINSVRASQNVYALMCGDGGNDVGALKEADVGLALLSGFGAINAGDSKPKDEVQDAEKALQDQREEGAVKAKESSKKAQEEFARKKADLMSKQQQWVEEEMAARRERGEDTGMMGQFSAMKTVMGRLKDEIQKEQAEIQKKHGNAFAAGAAKWAGELEGMEETPMVQPGDASTAAPFTTRAASIGACVDTIRQGRCTLLSAVQQMQIMMLESMIAAYTMSTMTVDGTRPSEAQMMASGTLLSVASIAFSFARPVDRMHRVRPLSSVFHPSLFISMIGQLAIHLGCMVYIASLAKVVMGPEEVQAVIDFEKERDKHIAGLDESTFDDWNWFMSVPFRPNLLNTCCWLVESSQQISVMFVNYKGRPWMKGLLENQPLFLSLFGCIALVGVCAWGLVPQLNELLGLLIVPAELRLTVMATLSVSLIGSFVWDRLMCAIFAPHIFRVAIEEAKATKIGDFAPLLTTIGYIVGGVAVLYIGNPLVLGGIWWIWRKRKQQQAAATVATS